MATEIQSGSTKILVGGAVGLEYKIPGYRSPMHYSFHPSLNSAYQILTEAREFSIATQLGVSSDTRPIDNKFLDIYPDGLIYYTDTNPDEVVRFMTELKDKLLNPEGPHYSEFAQGHSVINCDKALSAIKPYETSLVGFFAGTSLRITYLSQSPRPDSHLPIVFR